MEKDVRKMQLRREEKKKSPDEGRQSAFTLIEEGASENKCLPRQAQ